MFVQRLIAVSLFTFGAVVAVPTVAPAASYKCEPGAIKAKKDYVVSQFAQYVGGKYKGTGALGPVLVKIWDGNGDCDPNGNAPSKLPPDALLNLLLVHYYGDIMTASANVAAGKLSDARPYIDDYKQVHGIVVGDMKAAFDASFFKQDKGMTSEMHDLDAQVGKAGFKSKVSEKI